MLTVGSLFAGIGGFDLGLERAGMRTVWQVELDPFCRAVLAQHFPDADRHEDVCAVGAHCLQPVDIICGGFPCQDLSYAGAGAGLAGARSGLWSEYARIVGELRPRYVVVENVAALLARGLGVVLSDLAALGYDAEWDCIPASAVGAPHRRDRIWLVAYPNGEGEPGVSVDAQLGCGIVVPGRVGDPNCSPQDAHAAQGTSRSAAGERGSGTGNVADPQGEGLAGAGLRGRPTDRGPHVADADEERRDRRAGELRSSRRAEPADGGQGVADPEGQRRGAQRPQGAGEGGADGVARHAGEWAGSVSWAAEPDVGRVAHGVPARVDRLRALGNALVPQIAEWIGRRIVAYEAGAQ